MTGSLFPAAHGPAISWERIFATAHTETQGFEGFFGPKFSMIHFGSSQESHLISAQNCSPCSEWPPVYLNNFIRHIIRFFHKSKKNSNPSMFCRGPIVVVFQVQILRIILRVMSLGPRYARRSRGSKARGPWRAWHRFSELGETWVPDGETCEPVPAWMTMWWKTWKK